MSVTAALKEHYTNYYSGDQSLSHWRRLGAIDKARNIMELCASLSHDKILEIGCGDGAVLEQLSAKAFGSQLAGIEISRSAVCSAQQKQIPNCQIDCFDGDSIPFEDQIFDLAILTHVLEHVEHPRKVLYEAARVAKCVFIEVPLEDNATLPDDYVFDPVGHINFYSPRSIRQLVQTCGFHILSTKIMHSSLPLYLYRKGAVKGRFTYLVKDIALKCSLELSTKIWTYHSALVFSRITTAKDGKFEKIDAGTPT